MLSWGGETSWVKQSRERGAKPMQSGGDYRHDCCFHCQCSIGIKRKAPFLVPLCTRSRYSWKFVPQPQANLCLSMLSQCFQFSFSKNNDGVRFMHFGNDSIISLEGHSGIATEEIAFVMWMHQLSKTACLQCGSSDCWTFIPFIPAGHNFWCKKLND